MARDARTTASLKTRLADAILELLKTKSLEEISVSEITDLADVGRTTYYRHFTSKDDLIVHKFDTIFGHNLRHPPIKGHSTEISREAIQSAFEDHLARIYDNRAVFETVYTADLDYLLFRYMYRSTTEAAQSDQLIDKYLVALHAASSFAIVDQWISSGFAQTSEELSEMLLNQLHRHHSRDHARSKGCKNSEEKG